MKKLVFLAAFAILTSCSTVAKFPVSTVVPAAEIAAKKTKQGQYNYLITLNALNLASPERLEPSRKLYVIWAVSASGVVRNVGHFVNKNAEVSVYKASFPYEPAEIFITAEDEEGNCLPGGTEISRVKF